MALVVYVFTDSDFNILCVRGIKYQTDTIYWKTPWSIIREIKNGRLRFRVCLKRYYTT